MLARFFRFVFGNLGKALHDFDLRAFQLFNELVVEGDVLKNVGHHVRSNVSQKHDDAGENQIFDKPRQKSVEKGGFIADYQRIVVNNRERNAQHVSHKHRYHGFYARNKVHLAVEIQTGRQNRQHQHKHHVHG